MKVKTLLMNSAFLVTILFLYTKLNAQVERIFDIDRNVYKTIRIGEQIWMAENLRTTHYADGTPLINGKDAGILDPYNAVEYYFNYNNDEQNVILYGRLFTYAAAIHESILSNNLVYYRIQGVCPSGWHVPSSSEWDQSRAFLGSNSGGKMKTTGTIEEQNGFWYSQNNGATNQSGFSALPAGRRDREAGFIALGEQAGWWSINMDNSLRFITVLTLTNERTNSTMFV